MGIEEISCECPAPLPLLSLNHVSFVCRSVRISVRFYEEVLGFVPIKRPSSFNFNGAWLFNYGIGIHLLESNKMEDIAQQQQVINPKDNHISFQCSDMGLVKRNLEEMGIKYVTAVVEEGGIKVDQLFFHDPDGYMIEICNCDNLPVLPLSACPLKPKESNLKIQSSKSPLILPLNEKERSFKAVGCGVMENLMMESLSMNMLNMSF
ncbi:glyoxylase I 4-like [Magnolia sinica]|uniref:glyoxylase I 4-like n=1 Tax=Magnolia sinica TaxID=86752 RepID=UPI0026588404|nr:glyoxylase I 4-like [Magnolia sinica]